MANVRFENITVGYGDHMILKDFSLEVESGQIVCLVGPSGCGKTTLVRALLGLNKPETGTITVGDKVLFDSKKRINVPAEKRNIGIVFQDYAVWPHMTVIENVSYPLKKQRRPKDEIKQRAMHALEQVRMTEYANHLPSQLSGGQQQRVAIARALVNEPKVLLLDEPLGALDAKLRKEMQGELKKIQKEIGITFVFVTHDQEEALTMSDTVVVMNEGTIQQIGSPIDIYNEPENRFVAGFIGESNIIDGVMNDDFLVTFDDVQFECVDNGFPKNEPVDVVLRPEDIDIVKPEDGKLQGVVRSVTFMGVHYEIVVETAHRDYRIHTTDYCAPGTAVGLTLTPDDIHVMWKTTY